MKLHLRWLIFVTMFAIPAACKPQETPTQQKKKPATTNVSDNEPIAPVDEIPSSEDAEKKDDCFDLAKKSSFALAASYTWDDDVREIIDEYCISCHDSGSRNSDFSTYNRAQKDADEIGDWVDREKMPPEDSKQLSSSARRKLLSWVENGAPRDQDDATKDEDEEDFDEERDDDDTSSDFDSDDDCEEEDDRDDDRLDDDEISDLDSGWKELLATDEVEKCERKGKLFDRTAKECHSADIAESFQCNDRGVKNAFKAIGIDVTKELSRMDDEGFVLDQCGEAGGDPIVFFIKRTEGDDTIGLKVRKLCKKGSSICL